MSILHSIYMRKETHPSIPVKVICFQIVECLFFMEWNVARKSENRIFSKIFMMIIYLLLWNISTIYANFKMSQDAIFYSGHTIFEMFVWAAISVNNGMRIWARIRLLTSNGLKPKKHFYYHGAIIWFLFGELCVRIFFDSVDDKTSVWRFGRLSAICSAAKHFER